MNLSELSLRRPVLAIVCSIVIIIFGGIGYKYLGVREYPAIDPEDVGPLSVPILYVRERNGGGAPLAAGALPHRAHERKPGDPAVRRMENQSGLGDGNLSPDRRQSSGGEISRNHRAHPERRSPGTSRPLPGLETQGVQRDGTGFRCVALRR